MREQVDNTQVRLRELFDPDLFPLPRADFALRAKELGTALSFYVRRAIRYGLLAQTAGDAALDIIEKLDQGYKLDIRLLGVVFERAGRGAHEDEEEPGFQVYRFGGDVAQELLTYAVGRHKDRRNESNRSTDSRTSLPLPEEVVAGTASELESFRAALSVQSLIRLPSSGPTPSVEATPSGGVVDIAQRSEPPHSDLSAQASGNTDFDETPKSMPVVLLARLIRQRAAERLASVA
jgi:hypothetical protein